LGPEGKAAAMRIVMEKLIALRGGENRVARDLSWTRKRKEGGKDPERFALAFGIFVWQDEGRGEKKNGGRNP